MKSRVAAAVLAFFLGSIGIDYFYCNKIKEGLIVLGAAVLALVLSLVVIGFIMDVLLVVYAWIRAVKYIIKSEEEFNKLYVKNA